jgi:hypothetical protein
MNIDKKCVNQSIKIERFIQILVNLFPSLSISQLLVEKVVEL